MSGMFGKKKINLIPLQPYLIEQSDIHSSEAKEIRTPFFKTVK